MLSNTKQEIVQMLIKKIESWLESEGNARSTLAGALVVLDTIRVQAPFSETDVFTNDGQLVGGRGHALRTVLERYGENRKFLADGVTTRSARKFMRLAQEIDWAVSLSGWSDEEREEAVRLLAAPIMSAINDYFERRHMILRPDRQLSPIVWIEDLFEGAKTRSQGRVEQHMVWSKLKKRFPDLVDVEHAAFAGDAQTGRSGDIVVGDIVFHVTVAPALPVIEKCGRNLQSGKQPVLVVPRRLLDRAKTLAEVPTPPLHRHIAFVAIEDFLATNIIEMAEGQRRQFIEVLKAILEIYNDVIDRRETDDSLHIEIE